MRERSTDVPVFFLALNRLAQIGEKLLRGLECNGLIERGTVREGTLDVDGGEVRVSDIAGDEVRRHCLEWCCGGDAAHFPA